MSVRIGTSGWSYPSGRGTWNGVFYPSTPSPRRGLSGRRIPAFDELAYYAEHFDTVEVNSTFYRPPSPEVSRRWVQRTPAGFVFSLKLYQKFTHPKMFEASTGQSSAAITRSDVDWFLAGLDPVVSAGKLGALLAQFPPSFKRDSVSRDYLGGLLHAFRGWRVAVELRHRSWSDDGRNTLALLDEFSATWVQIDEPKFTCSIRQDDLPHAGGFFYMRLHGRNAAAWWHHREAEDRYDYLYTQEELKPFAEIAAATNRQMNTLYLYMNNHFAAKAVANAAILKHQLGMPIAGDYPPAMVARYPELAGVVTVSDAPLLPASSS